MSSSDVALSVRGLSKSYTIAHNAAKHTTAGEAIMHRLRNPFQKVERETFWALKDVNFDIQKGDVVGVIGRNGAGKSTLLKILSRITEPTTGEINLNGRVGSLLEVGTGFHQELTGRENIFLNGAILGMSRQEIAKQFDAIVNFAGVEQFLDTPVKRYSSGMYVRLAFAVAAHLNPEILIVDEVLAVGDSEFQKKCMGKMQDVSMSGRTVLFVSHNMAAIQQLCNKSLLFRMGRLIKQGQTEDVVIDYMRDGLEAENGIFDLGNHVVRSHQHTSIIRRLALSSADGTTTSCFHPEDVFGVEMFLEPTMPIQEPRVAVAIEDGQGRRICTMASYFGSQDIPTLDRPCRVKCVLPKLNLGQGRYLISVSVGDRYRGLLDSVDSAAWFEVEWNNNYGNSEPHLPVYGPVLTESNWEYMNTHEYNLALV